MRDLPALILAGGLGTRLRGVIADRPKVLAPVAGRPFLSYLLDQVQAAGVREVVLCAGHRADQLEQTFGPRYGDLTLTYSRETQPLGTGGALRLALTSARGDLLLALNGDSYVDAPLAEFVAWYRARQFAGSLLLTWVPDGARFGTVEVDAYGRIRSFREKRGQAEPGWINAGVYLLTRALLETLPEGHPVSLEHEAFPRWRECGLGGFACRARFLDVGTPASFAQAETFFAEVGQ